MKADLQASRQNELELKGRINSILSKEQGVKAEISQLQQDNENLQAKLHNLVTARQQDKQKHSQLEKKLQEEKKNRSALESQLNLERKAKKFEENAAHKALAIATSKVECPESCKNEKQELENDLKRLKRDLKAKDDQVRQMDQEAQSLRQCKVSHDDTEILMSALSAMQDKNIFLENSLSAETRLKLDLFSALGETKRQLDISQGILV